MNGENITGNLNQGSNLGATGNAPPVFPGAAAPKKKSKKIVLGVIIGLVVIIAGAVIVLAAGIWDPVWNPFRVSPDKILEQAIENMAKVQTAHIKLVITLDGRNDEVFKARMIIEGDSDDSDANNSKMQLTLDLSVFTEGVEMLFAGESRYLDDITYFKIKTIPIPLSASLAAMGINLEEWRDKWFRWDVQELGMSFGLGGLSKSREEEAAMEKEVKDLLAKYPVLKAKKRLPEQEIDGQKTYHYLVDVDKENLKPFLAGVVELLNKYYQQSGIIEQLSAQEKEEMFKGIDEAFEALGGELSFEIWIGKSDKLIYKIAGQKLIDLSKMEEGEQGELDIKFEMVNSKFNQPVKIEAPAESKSIIEMLMPLLQIYWTKPASIMEEGAGFPVQ